jgi:hypothetical protein
MLVGTGRTQREIQSEAECEQRDNHLTDSPPNHSLPFVRILDER